MTELSAVSRTALGVAAVRAQESLRQDRLFDDPWASHLLSRALDDGAAVRIAAGLRPALQAHIVGRTRFYDEHLARGHERQVVLLGAGLDTRAVRLDWAPGTTVWELDLPALLAVKEDLLEGAAARCRRVVVPVDLLGDWSPALVASGFDPSLPTSWLAEGLLVYFGADQAAGLLEAMTSLSAPGSRFACELALPTTAQQLAGIAAPSLTQMWRGGLGEELLPWLQSHGWRPSVSTLAEVLGRAGRSGGEDSRSAFVSAARTDGSPQQ